MKTFKEKFEYLTVVCTADTPNIKEYVDCFVSGLSLSQEHKLTECLSKFSSNPDSFYYRPSGDRSLPASTAAVFILLSAEERLRPYLLDKVVFYVDSQWDDKDEFFIAKELWLNGVINEPFQNYLLKITVSSTDGNDDVFAIFTAEDDSESVVNKALVAFAQSYRDYKYDSGKFVSEDKLFSCTPISAQKITDSKAAILEMTAIGVFNEIIDIEFDAESVELYLADNQE